MYKSEKHNLSRKIAIVTIGLVLGLSSVYADNTKRNYTPATPESYPYHGIVTNDKGQKINIDGSVVRPAIENGVVHHSPVKNYKPGLGTKATQEMIDAWNVDVRPDGKGLPSGQMTVEKGAEVFSVNCASCHGEFGEGAGKNPVLVGGLGTLKNQAQTGGDESPEKTIGSYGPYVAPLFWYIKVAMPLPTPKKLTNDEVYGILGYLMQLNEVEVDGKEIEDDTVIDAAFIKKIHLPNEKGFEYNDLRHPYSHGNRCMKECIDDTKTKVVKIEIDATESIEPSIKMPRYSMAKPKKKGGDQAETDYKASCAACHDSGAAGAPVVGDKGEWGSRIKKGTKMLNSNAINGFNGMPPKGGNMSLSDDQTKAIVNFMINKSK